MVNKEILNIVLLGLAFACFLFSFGTLTNAQKYLLKSIEKDDPTFTVNAYLSFCVHFTGFVIITLFAPYITSLIGPRPTMVVAALLQLVYIIQFLFPMNWLVYSASALRGVAAGIIWTAQGRYLTQNSSKTTITRNSGIFFGLLQINKVIGNIYVYFRFNNVDFTKGDRMELYGVMVGGCILCCIVLLCLPIAVYNEPVKMNLLKSIVSVLKLSIQRDMLLLLFTFVYIGLELSFYMGIYSNAIGFTLTFGWVPIKLIALSGLMTGLGSILTGLTFTFIGKRLTEQRRCIFVIIGCLLHILTFIIIIINIPNKSPHGPTRDKAIIECNIYLALICSFILGLVDAIYFTQIYGFLGIHFKEEITAAHAIFRFAQGLATIASFFYASEIGMYWIQGILIVFALLGTTTFCIVELKPSYHSPTTINPSIYGTEESHSIVKISNS